MLRANFVFSILEYANTRQAIIDHVDSFGSCKKVDKLMCNEYLPPLH